MRELDPRAVARLLCAIGRLIRTLIELISTVVQYSVIRHRPAQALAAENLFLRKQLALFREREVRPTRSWPVISSSLSPRPEVLDPSIRHLGLRVLRTPRSGSDTSTQRGRIAP